MSSKEVFRKNIPAGIPEYKSKVQLQFFNIKILFMFMFTCKSIILNVSGIYYHLLSCQRRPPALLGKSREWRKFARWIHGKLFIANSKLASSPGICI